LLTTTLPNGPVPPGSHGPTVSGPARTDESTPFRTHPPAGATRFTLTQAAVAVPTAAPAPAVKRRFHWRSFRPGLLLASLFVILLIVAATVPGWLVPGDPLQSNARQAFREPSLSHIFGTDENGRDVFVRIVYGARTSLFVGISASVVSLVMGVTVGLLAGLGHRYLDSTLMRGVDVLLAFPDILLALLIITFWGPGVINALVAIGVASIPRYARLARAQAHLVSRSSYVEAATALGQSRFTIIVRHILPNAIKPVLVLALIGIGGKISQGAGLSFLGLGIPPPTPEWGAMLSTGREYLINAPWLTIIPGLALTFTVLSVSTLGREVMRRSEGKSA